MNEISLPLDNKSIYAIRDLAQKLQRIYDVIQLTRQYGWLPDIVHQHIASLKHEVAACNVLLIRLGMPEITLDYVALYHMARITPPRKTKRNKR